MLKSHLRNVKDLLLSAKYEVKCGKLQFLKVWLLVLLESLRNFAAYHWSRYDKRHTENSFLRRRIRQAPHGRVLLFLSPQATELRKGIREKNRRGGSLDLMRLPTERPLGACCKPLKGLRRQDGLFITVERSRWIALNRA